MHYFGYQREGLQSSRPQILNQQQRCKVSELPFVAHRENRTQASEINVAHTHLVVTREGKASKFRNRPLRLLACNLKHCVLCGIGPSINQVQDDTFICSHDGSVRLPNEVAYRGRVPMVAPCQTTSRI